MSDDWLQQSIDIDIRTLQDFAETVRAAYLDFNTSMANGVIPLMSVRPSFGNLAVKEGAYLGEAHSDQIEAAAMMLSDVQLGLAALANAADSIALDYMTGDALAQATLDDVRDAFTVQLPAAADTGGTDATATDAGGVEAPVESMDLPPEAYSDGTEGTDEPGSGRYIAPDTPGEFPISADDEGVYTAPDAEDPRA